MRIERILFGIFCLVTQSLQAQVSYLAQDEVAVFYPSAFQEADLMPSQAIISDLQPWKALPSSWKLRPMYDKQGTKSVVTLQINETTDLYGTGEVVGNLRRNGSDISLWNTDNYTYAKWSGKQLYQSHPWILGVNPDGSAFGVIIDSTWKMIIDLSNGIKITSDGPAPRVIIIQANHPMGVVRKLTELTGRIELPPLWTLGYQQARFSYFPDTQVQELADNFRSKQIPCDVIWMDIDYMDHRKVFTFNKELFPNPAKLNQYLHDRGFKAVYMIDPGIKKEANYSIYDSGQAFNAWVKDSTGTNAVVGKVWPGDCVFPDYTRPDVRKWWACLTRDFMKTGIDGIWNDMNEPAVFNGTTMTLSENCIHLGGAGIPKGPHARYHNVYGLFMLQSTLNGIKQALPQKRPFVLSRAGFLGIQRYGATWTGDNASTWDYLRVSIPMSINLSLSGMVFNGPDVGGFSGDTNPDLLSNWMAIGPYYPFFRNHAADNAIHQEPWSFDKQTEDISRTAINRRYRLLPYLYTCFRQASVDGTPVMQPLFFADVKDSKLRNEQEVFLLGSDLMILPRWAENPSLPRGDWEILSLEKKDDGVQPYVALRDGAIVPMGNVIQNTTSFKNDSITIYVNPDAQGLARGTWYSDAGDGYDYSKGDYSVTEFSSSHKGKQLIVNAKTIEGKTCAFTYRVAYVCDGRITYSQWTSSAKPVALKWFEDKQNGIVFNKLKMQKRAFAQKDLDFMTKHKHKQSSTIDLY